MDFPFKLEFSWAFLNVLSELGLQSMVLSCKLIKIRSKVFSNLGQWTKFTWSEVERGAELSDQGHRQSQYGHL
jgi:hypothetical protein